MPDDGSCGPEHEALCDRTRRVLDGISSYVCFFTISVTYSECVCVCCRRYSARNEHAQYFHL